MTDTFEWRGRVGEAWAEEWRRTDRTLAPVNDALLAAIAGEAVAFAAPRILDVGCGAGATSLALAERINDARITGIDLSAPLVAAARERAGARQNLRFEVADAARWAPPAGSFDLIVSRHGVMFFDDPVAAFANLRALAAPDARLVFSCFRERAANGWAAALAPVVARFAPAAPDPAVGPFAFADPARIESILDAAGFAPPAIAPLDFAFVAGAGEDPVADAIAYFSRIGPFASLLRTLGEAERQEALAMVAAIAAAHADGGKVVFRAAAWIVTSRAS